jgi:TonB family protein
MARCTPLLLLLLLSPSLRAADEDVPKMAGQDVPVPQRTKTVLPEYPAEAQAKGIHGLVIVEFVVDKEGHVASAQVVRSIPGLDEAALAAVRRWEYQVTKVAGQPVSVRMTAPISFLMKVPTVQRQDGIPELRQGATPEFPPGGYSGKAEVVTADLTLAADGKVADFQVTGGTPAFALALMKAVKTWNFAPPGENVVIGFRVEATFHAGDKGGKPVVDLRLSGLRRSESAEGAAGQQAPPAAPGQPPAPAPETAKPEVASPASAHPEPSPAAPVPVPPIVPAPSPSPAAPAGGATIAPPAAPAPQPSTPTPRTEPTAPAQVQPPAAPPQAAPNPGPPAPKYAAATPDRRTPPSAQGAPAAGKGAPSTEVLSVPTPPPPAEPPEPGGSAVRDVLVEQGVPELVKGRRPVVPPFARIEGQKGEVEVRFRVDAAGGTFVTDVNGPDLFKTQAEQAVSSWTFHRTKATRLALVALFSYKGDIAQAVVRPAE